MFDAEIEAANIACACADRLYNVSMVHLCTYMYNVYVQCTLMFQIPIL